MKRILVTIKSLDVKNYDRKTDDYDLNIILDINNQEKILIKKYKCKDKPKEIISDLIQLIRNKFKKEDYDNPLEQTIIIIKDLEYLEEKMINFVKLINNKIRDFRSYKSYKNYIYNYTSFSDGFSIKF